MKSVDSGRFPLVSQLLGVEGRDEPGQDDRSVSLCVTLIAARCERDLRSANPRGA
ncbi:hypothetical+protein [Methylocapsa aurea]